MKPAGERRSRASGERINIGALPPDRIRRGRVSATIGSSGGKGGGIRTHERRRVVTGGLHETLPHALSKTEISFICQVAVFLNTNRTMCRERHFCRFFKVFGVKQSRLARE